ncbi:hypothetical protein RPPX_15295 [Pseudomonas putida S12]|jgi:hypothetical protein|uniref:Uncharacterized protein n=1 Tax=Pseudomonas putida S12 TaxID=1215087 RepID=A0AA34RWH9_PSEPU|nr:hypothetical protein RPPX_15295 [Pseudomonas putida S12]RIZ44037.1 hypothetical protein CIK02_06290 [Pseudomonas putida]
MGASLGIVVCIWFKNLHLNGSAAIRLKLADIYLRPANVQLIDRGAFSRRLISQAPEGSSQVVEKPAHALPGIVALI